MLITEPKKREPKKGKDGLKTEIRIPGQTAPQHNNTSQTCEEHFESEMREHERIIYP